MTLGRDGGKLQKGDFRRVGQMMFVNAATEMSQFGFFILLGLVALPLLFEGIPLGFGLMLPAGFVGGHGTAAAIGGELAKAGWVEAPSIGFTFATIGLLGGVASGVALINFGARCGFISSLRSGESLPKDLCRGWIAPGHRRSLGEETIHPASMDSITWTLSLILMCVGAAYGINHLLASATGLSVPVYGLALLCGFALSQALWSVGAAESLDKRLVTHVGSSATDYLIAFGIASINVKVVMDNLAPLALLVVAGFAFVLLWFLASRWIFNDYWFERSLFIYGMSTGVFSTGVLLLRIADPRFETGVLIDVGLAWIVLSIVDILLVTFSPLIVLQGGGLAYGLLLCFASAALVVLARRWFPKTAASDD